MVKYCFNIAAVFMFNVLVNSKATLIIYAVKSSFIAFLIILVNITSKRTNIVFFLKNFIRFFTSYLWLGYFGLLKYLSNVSIIMLFMCIISYSK